MDNSDYQLVKLAKLKSLDEVRLHALNHLLSLKRKVKKNI